MFQSTRPRGARHVIAQITQQTLQVSIHAPARGATIAAAAQQQRNIVSIHAPARGATRPHRRVVPPRRFQSTRPRGARRATVFSAARQRQFQSTRPRGARPGRTGEKYGIIAFQSTRPRGARRRARNDSHALACFNPRAREGRDFTKPAGILP